MVTKRVHSHAHGVNNIIYCVYIDATDARPGIVPLFGEKMRANGEAERWGVGLGGHCALACVIIRAETIECTQNAE